MKRAPQAMVALVRAIDRFTDVVGTCVAWLAVPLVFAVIWEVFARYVLGSPSRWAFEVIYQLYAALFMLGAAYALHKGAHVRTDFFFEKWSIRTRGIIDSVAYIGFFFPSLLVLLYLGTVEAMYSFRMGEQSEQTPWRPVMWPFRSVLPLACLLLLVQGVSETIKSLYAARTGVELEHKEKVEV